jgi:maltooligosyltrehalose synthase
VENRTKRIRRLQEKEQRDFQQNLLKSLQVQLLSSKQQIEQLNQCIKELNEQTSQLQQVIRKQYYNF